MVENLVGEVDKCLPNGSCHVPVLQLHGIDFTVCYEIRRCSLLDSCKLCCKVSMYRLWNVTVIPIVNTNVALQSLY